MVRAYTDECVGSCCTARTTSWEVGRVLYKSGFFAAGVSSAITAPLAAAYATAGIFGLTRDLRSWQFRPVWIFILLSGIIFSVSGFQPVRAIVFRTVCQRYTAACGSRLSFMGYEQQKNHGR